MSSCCGGCGSSVFRLQVEWTRPSCPALSAALPEDLLHQTWSGVKHGPRTQMSQLESVANKRETASIDCADNVLHSFLIAHPPRVSLFYSALTRHKCTNKKLFHDRSLMKISLGHLVLKSWCQNLFWTRFPNLRTYNDPSLPRIRD